MNSEQIEEQQPDVGKVSLGKHLRTAREEQGHSVKDVADSLRLRISVIEEIEEDKFNPDEIPIYTRGYIRAYAKFLGINVEHLLKQSTALPVVQMQSFSRKTRQKKNDNRLMTLTWTIFSVAVGITIIWWWQLTQKENAADLQENKAVSSQVSALPDAQNTAKLTNSSSENSENTTKGVQSPENTEVTELATNVKVSPEPEKENSQVAEVEKPKAAEKPTEVVKKPVAKQSPIAMNFIADCWVDVRDGNGKRLLTGIKSRGESIELNGKEPFKIVLGAPSAVELTFKGKKIDLSGYPPKRVARLTLPQK